MILLILSVRKSFTSFNINTLAQLFFNIYRIDFIYDAPFVFEALTILGERVVERVYGFR